MIDFYPVRLQNYVLTVTARIKHPPPNVSKETNGRTQKLIKIIRNAQLQTKTVTP